MEKGGDLEDGKTANVVRVQKNAIVASQQPSKVKITTVTWISTKKTARYDK